MTKGSDVKAEKMSGDMIPAGKEAMAIATTRAAQEVQAAMVIAKKFPRDAIQAEKRILDACKRKLLAENAMYVYPRGGTTIEGPSIRLAEVLAQNLFGIHIQGVLVGSIGFRVVKGSPGQASVFIIVVNGLARVGCDVVRIGRGE